MKIVVPGPLHPDFFDGMTPIMTEVEARAFEVEVTWVERHSRAPVVLARDQTEARALARRQVVSEADGDVDDLETSIPYELDHEDWVTDAEIERYRKAVGRMNAKSVCSVTGGAR